MWRRSREGSGDGLDPAHSFARATVGDDIVGVASDRLGTFTTPSNSVATQRQLANPPLREALIDIQLAEPLPVQFAESLSERTIPGLERRQQLRSGRFEIKIGPHYEAVPKGEEPLGWRYESPDGSIIVQVRRNGITYSVLRGYRDWPGIREAARRVWQVYLEQVPGSVMVARTAARYINVLEFPSHIELNDYLTAAPQIPQGLPQTIDNFLQRVVIPYHGDISVIITQTLEPSVQTTRVILDIDVFAQRMLQGESPDLWSLIDTFRGIKNAVFFSSVTERALESYV